MMTTTKKRPPLFSPEDRQRSREQDQTAYRILADCDRRAGVWTGQPEETQRPWQGSVDTWDDWPGRRQRCKSCGNPRDLLADWPEEVICSPCGDMVRREVACAAFGRIADQMCRPVLPPHPTCPWIASLKADEV